MKDNTYHFVFEPQIKYPKIVQRNGRRRKRIETIYVPETCKNALFCVPLWRLSVAEADLKNRASYVPQGTHVLFFDPDSLYRNRALSADNQSIPVGNPRRMEHNRLRLRTDRRTFSTVAMAADAALSGADHAAIRRRTAERDVGPAAHQADLGRTAGVGQVSGGMDADAHCAAALRGTLFYRC